jgi:hypothetical protein
MPRELTARGTSITGQITDTELIETVASQHSWRGVLRALGLPENSSRHARLLRNRCIALGVEIGHFRGQRSWSDKQLITAAPVCSDWSELLVALGYPADSGSARNTIRGHCARIGISHSHLDGHAAENQPPIQRSPMTTHLRAAGPMLVAAFLTLEGYRVSWPLEPAPYDLLVTPASDAPSRVQVKTSVNREAGTWVCSLTRHVYSAKKQWHERRVYDLAEIDSFGVVDGDLGIYLIPAAVVGGLSAIHLRRYSRYRLGALPGPAELGSS